MGEKGWREELAAEARQLRPDRESPPGVDFDKKLEAEIARLIDSTSVPMSEDVLDVLEQTIPPVHASPVARARILAAMKEVEIGRRAERELAREAIKQLSFGHYVRGMRVYAKLSIHGVAKALAVTLDRVLHIESDRLPLAAISPKEAVALAQVLGASLERMLAVIEAVWMALDLSKGVVAARADVDLSSETRETFIESAARDLLAQACGAEGEAEGCRRYLAAVRAEARQRRGDRQK